MIPRKVQVLAILRLIDDVLNGKSDGVIGEIKTGEGKSFIISVVSIILVKYFHKSVDIVISNIQLATRDQADQLKYFKIFGIKTGVLISKNSEPELADICLTFASDNKVEHQYNTDIFNFPVVYSTNHDFQFVYLFSIFSANSRASKFQVVLIDEVDNMLIDESTTPSILSIDINYAYAEEIVKIVYSSYQVHN